MAIVYVFLEKSSYSNGETGSTNSLLELSAYCRTFSKAVNFRSNAPFKTSFFGDIEATSTEASQMSAARSALTGRLANTLGTGIPAGAGTLLSRLQSLIGGVDGDDQWTVISVAAGAELDGSELYPTYFELKYDLNYSPTPSETYIFKIWLKDEKFRDEYPLADFTVVPPIPNPLDFFYAYATARNQIIYRTLADHVNNAQDYLVGTVVTGYEALTLRIYNRENIAEYFDCPWFVGYNGKLGVTYAALIEAIKVYLLSLPGSPTLEEWLTVIPQLNPVGVYYAIPLWDQIAIPNVNPAMAPEMYRPLIPIGKENDLVNIFLGNFDNTEIDAKGEFTASIYKSCPVFIMPSSSNDGGNSMPFSSNYPDWCVIPLTDLPTQGLELTTQNAIEDLYQLLDIAETYIPPMAVPTDMTVENFGGRLFITMNDVVGGAKFYVMTRDAYKNYLLE